MILTFAFLLYPFAFNLAERVGFEPTEPVKAHSISNAANSTALAPFLESVKDKGERLKLSLSPLDLLRDRYKDRNQFFCLFTNRPQPLVIKEIHLFDQFQPIYGFLQFLQRAFDFTDKISIRFCMLGFTVLCPTDVPQRKICFPKTCASVVFGKAAKSLMTRTAKFFVRILKSSFTIFPTFLTPTLSPFILSPLSMAERVGFEPTEPVKAQQFSRLPDSTALAPLREPIILIFRVGKYQVLVLFNAELKSEYIIS